jgi:hypothetical protein
MQRKKLTSIFFYKKIICPTGILLADIIFKHGQVEIYNSIMIEKNKNEKLTIYAEYINANFSGQICYICL